MEHSTACDDHTGIFTCDGCARDPYLYVPAETQSCVIKLSCSRKGPCRQRGLNSEPLGYNYDPESATIATAPARHIEGVLLNQNFFSSSNFLVFQIVFSIVLLLLTPKRSSTCTGACISSSGVWCQV